MRLCADSLRNKAVRVTDGEYDRSKRLSPEYSPCLLSPDSLLLEAVDRRAPPDPTQTPNKVSMVHTLKNIDGVSAAMLYKACASARSLRSPRNCVTAQIAGCPHTDVLLVYHTALRQCCDVSTGTLLRTCGESAIACADLLSACESRRIEQYSSRIHSDCTRACLGTRRAAQLHPAMHIQLDSASNAVTHAIATPQRCPCLKPNRELTPKVC